jgi:hypothetical protein
MTNTHDIISTPASIPVPTENPAVADIKARWAADPSASKSRKECMAIGSWGLTTQISKEKRGILRAYADGASVRITTQSLYEHLIALAGAPAHKARKPTASFRHKRRIPREAELDALRRGNEKRRLEAQERRQAREQAREQARGNTRSITRSKKGKAIVEV